MTGMRAWAMAILALLLAGCAANPNSQPASFNAHVNGSYTALGGVVGR